MLELPVNKIRFALSTDRLCATIIHVLLKRGKLIRANRDISNILLLPEAKYLSYSSSRKITNFWFQPHVISGCANYGRHLLSVCWGR